MTLGVLFCGENPPEVYKHSKSGVRIVCFYVLLFVLFSLRRDFEFIEFLSTFCSNDYQMIMTVLYKRLNDTGRNWRHVYKVHSQFDNQFMDTNGSLLPEVSHRVQNPGVWLSGF